MLVEYLQMLTHPHWARARSDENRMVSSQWGPGADMKQRALDMANAI